MRHTWTLDQKRAVVPGATVVASGGGLDQARYEIVGNTDDSISLRVNGFEVPVPFSSCDPDSMRLAENASQLELLR